MDLDKYFKPALEMAQLVYKFDEAVGERKEQLGRQIYNSEFMAHTREIQTFSEGEFLRGEMPARNVNTAKMDFFYSPAIPRFGKSRGLHEMPYHRHEYLELVVVLRGTYSQYINGILYEHSAGSICMFNPNVIHRDVVPAPDDRVMFLGLSQNYLWGDLALGFQSHEELVSFWKRQSGRGAPQYILFHPPEFERVEQLIGQILDEDTEKLAGHHFVINGLLTRLLSVLTEGQHYEVCSQSELEIHAKLIERVLQYMQEHLTTVTRKEVAAFFHFNPDYLNRLLQSITGQSYSTHLREMRLAWAAEQLRGTEMSVNTIIHELGFSNKGYFNSVFKGKYGVLPGEYRSSTWTEMIK